MALYRCCGGGGKSSLTKEWNVIGISYIDPDASTETATINRTDADFLLICGFYKYASQSGPWSVNTENNAFGCISTVGESCVQKGFLEVQNKSISGLSGQTRFTWAEANKVVSTCLTSGLEGCTLIAFCKYV
jgi:hypothetical protein